MRSPLLRAPLRALTSNAPWTLATAALLSPLAGAQCELGPYTDGVGAPIFGTNISGGSERMLISEPAGRALVYRRYHEEPDVEFARPTGSTGTSYGAGLAIGDGRALVGDPTEGAGGTVWVHAILGGQLLATLTGTPGAEFGASLQLFDGRLWVGAPGADRVDVFDAQTFAFMNTLVGAAGSRFGAALDAAGATIAIGAPGGPGAVYVFAASGQPISTWSAPTAQSGFGASVALRGPLGIVGASSGGAWIHDVASGARLHTLDAGAPVTQEFGARVLLTAGGAAVSDPASNISAPGAGAIHLFDPQTGASAGSWLRSGVAAGDRFGAGLGACGMLLVGACGNAPDVAVLAQGGADRNGNGLVDDCEMLGATVCTSRLNSTGLQAHAFAQGPGLAGGLDLVLVADGLPLGEPGYFLCAQQAAHVPAFGGGQGVLCLGAPIVRLAINLSVPNAVGLVAIEVVPGYLPPAATLASGETWTFQYWFRDHNPQPTSNTSSAVRVDF